jgi:hypothetical protein
MLIFLAEAAAAAATAVEPSVVNTHTIISFLIAIIGVRIVQWAADLFTSKGEEFVHAKLDALQAKLNENSLLGQIAADDAVTAILQDAIPTVIHELSETAKKDLEDGKFDKVDWNRRSLVG